MVKLPILHTLDTHLSFVLVMDLLPDAEVKENPTFRVC